MRDRTAIFSICSNNYLPQAEVFFDSARRFHPQADLYLGLADKHHPQDPYPAGVEILAAEHLGIPDFTNVAFRYDIMEFNTAIKPFVMLDLFGRGYGRVIYFDPDIEIFRPLDGILAALDAGASFLLTPHFCAPPGPQAPKSERDVMRTGIFNLGFVACGRSAETERLLRWWARKLRYDCVNDQPAGLFVDQKFMDFIPAFAENFRSLGDPSLNVAYWNIAGRDLRRDGAGWTVDGRPLGFFHFSGFNPKKSGQLSKYAPELQVSEDLRALLDHYATKMLAAGVPPQRPYAYGHFASGTPIPDVVRRMFRDRHPVWVGDPFATYEDYVGLPAPQAASGAMGEIVSNIMQDIHDRSDDLRARFRISDPYQVSFYARWFARHAREIGMSEHLWRPAQKRREELA
jgi:hypothetical protein